MGVAHTESLKCPTFAKLSFAFDKFINERAAMLEKTLLTIGAVSIILGVIIFYIAGTFHSGHEPNNLVVPQYSANTNWVTVHLARVGDRRSWDSIGRGWSGLRL